MLIIYTYSNCDTCRQAVKWLRAQGIAFTEKPIRETPPTMPELKRMLQAQEGDLRRLFNTAGREYRALKLAEKLPALSEREALGLLAGNGHLVKRPFLVGEEARLVGYDEATWTAALAGGAGPRSRPVR